MDIYKVAPITKKQEERIVASLDFGRLYTRKVSIHGTCIKLFSDSREIVGMWEGNFNPMDERIRPHGRIFVFSDKSKKLKVQFEPTSKTVFVRNCCYYGWVKSIALALASEYLWDSPSVENRRYPVHGSLVDIAGKGLAIVGRPKSGKTTLTYGLMRNPECSFLTDDWFFVRLMNSSVLAFSAEKNSYAEADIAKHWPELSGKLKHAKGDSHGRSILDVAYLFGESRVSNQSHISAVVLLARDPKLPAWQKLSAKKARELMLKWDFCNPHQLRRSKERKKEHSEFFSELFSRVPVYLLNTVETPAQSLARLEEIALKK